MTRRSWLSLPIAYRVARAEDAEPADASAELVDCRAYYADPQLDFEFRFFHRYLISIPLRQLAGPSRQLVLRAHVKPLDVEGAEPMTFERRAQTIAIGKAMRGDIDLQSAFVSGPGRYSVLWEYRDTLGNACSVTWQVEARPNRRQRKIRLSLAPGEIADARSRIFRREQVEVEAGAEKRPLRIKALVNFDPYDRPRRRPRSSVRLLEFVPRLAALRALSRHPRVGRVAMTAFSIDEQQVLVRHGLANAFDFPALRRAMDELSPALVDISQLGKDKDKEFFSELLLEELRVEEPIDAFVFLGPDGEFGRRTPRETIEALEPVVSAPIVFLNSSPITWRGLVGSAVKRLNGKEIRFRTPVELAKAVEQAVERIDSA